MGTLGGPVQGKLCTAVRVSPSFVRLKMKILPIILCRGGSKGIHRKNIRLLNGRPLLSYVLEEALKIFPKVWVSTEDSEIKRIAIGWGAEVIDRPLKLAQDDSKSIDVVKHALNHLKAHGRLKFDYTLVINTCVPLLLAQDIQNVVDIAIGKKPDSVVSLVSSFDSHPSKICNLIDGEIHPINTAYSFETGERQKQIPVYKRNTALYLTKTSVIRKGSFFGKDVRGYVMPPERSLDLNSMWDWHLAELILKND